MKYNIMFAYITVCNEVQSWKRKLLLYYTVYIQHYTILTIKHFTSCNFHRQRKAWLEEALAAFTGENEVALMKKCLQILAAPTGKLSSDLEDDVMMRENALEQLESVVDIIDNARGKF